MKLDKELKVIMVNESESEMLQKYFRRDRTETTLENITGTNYTNATA